MNIEWIIALFKDPTFSGTVLGAAIGAVVAGFVSMYYMSKETYELATGCLKIQKGYDEDDNTHSLYLVNNSSTVVKNLCFKYKRSDIGLSYKNRIKILFPNEAVKISENYFTISDKKFYKSRIRFPFRSPLVYYIFDKPLLRVSKIINYVKLLSTSLSIYWRIWRLFIKINKKNKEIKSISDGYSLFCYLNKRTESTEDVSQKQLQNNYSYDLNFKIYRSEKYVKQAPLMSERPIKGLQSCNGTNGLYLHNEYGSFVISFFIYYFAVYSKIHMWFLQSDFKHDDDNYDRFKIDFKKYTYINILHFTYVYCAFLIKHITKKEDVIYEDFETYFSLWKYFDNNCETLNINRIRPNYKDKYNYGLEFQNDKNINVLELNNTKNMQFREENKIMFFGNETIIKKLSFLSNVEWEIYNKGVPLYIEMTNPSQYLIMIDNVSGKFIYYGLGTSDGSISFKYGKINNHKIEQLQEYLQSMTNYQDFKSKYEI